MCLTQLSHMDWTNTHINNKHSKHLMLGRTSFIRERETETVAIDFDEITQDTDPCDLVRWQQIPYE